MLFAARAGQDLGAAMLSPAALSIIVRTFADGRERTRALGAWGAVGGAGAAIGVLLGGALTALVDWRAIFLINLPVGLALAARAARGSSPQTRSRRAGAASTCAAPCSPPRASARSCTRSRGRRRRLDVGRDAGDRRGRSCGARCVCGAGAASAGLREGRVPTDRVEAAVVATVLGAVRAR